MAEEWHRGEKGIYLCYILPLLNLLKSSVDCFSSKTIVWFSLRKYFPGYLRDSSANNPGALIKLPCLTWNKSGSLEKYTPLWLLERPRILSTYSEKSASLLNDDWLTNITTAHLDLGDPKNEFRDESFGVSQ
jgi:hypothetical protein